MSRTVAAAAFFTVAAFIPPAYGDSGKTEVQARAALRVCADPSSMPYSNRQREGFENKIAELIARDLKIPLTYFWFPQSMGFVRSTLQARLCDVIVGISAAHERVLNTNPYYASAFALAYPAAAKYELTSLSDRKLKDKNLRIGLIAGTPPTGLLLENGLMGQVAPYHLVVDTRTDAPTEQIVKDMLSGKLDAAVLWGPFAGYLNKRHGSRLKVVPLLEDNSEKHRMVYRVTMGVRPEEVLWKRRLNKFIRDNQEKINAILSEYHVPLVEEE